MTTSDAKLLEGIDEKKYDFRNVDVHVFQSPRKGLDAEIVAQISAIKNEPQWMLDFRLKALAHFEQRPMPEWGGDLSALNLDEIYFYTKPTEGESRSWDDVPENIKTTFDRLGIPEAEQKFLAGVGAQYESEMVYHSIKEHLSEQGVIFKSIEQGLQDHEELFREYFSTVIPIEDNKFAALNSAVWSGGSFVYVPPGVTVDMPLQAYFRINTADLGQFERTLIIIDEGAQAHYVEGCTAPIYTTDSFHSGVIEIVVKPGARMRYTTIQNWSKNMYNLVTQRAFVYEGGKMEWVDANLGCLMEGSTVTTPSGQKAIEDLRVGEKVLSYDEETGELCFRPVLAKQFSGYQNVHEVSSGERRLFATSNHPFYSYSYDSDRPRKLGRYELSYVRADELSEAIIPRSSLDYGRAFELDLPDVETKFITKNQYQESLLATRVRERRLKVTERTTDELMWLFGLYLGDGHIRRSPGKTAETRYATVGFSVPSGSRARPKLEAVMADLHPGKPTERSDGVQVTWNSIELADLFETHGFKGVAQTKRVPEWVYSIPESQRLALLAGYIDADGSVIREKRRFSIKSANQELLKDTARLATTLGISSKIYTEYDEPREVEILGAKSVSNGSYRMEIPLDVRVFPFLSDEMCERARAVAPPKTKYNRKVGRSIIELPETVEIVKVSVGDLSSEKVPTWDIEVAGTGNFISEGFIVHNSKLTMKYPSCYLLGEKAHGEILSLAFAADGQHQDTGGKVLHFAPNTSSVITSKSISKSGGRASYRGLLKVFPEAEGSTSNVVCDALLLDDHSRSDTYPYIEIDAQDVTIGHEASVSKVGEEQLFYLMSRGLSEEEATTMVVAGFIEPLVKELPMEYAVEMNRLIQLQMEGSIG